MKDRIRKIRKDSGLTQEKFAEKLGIKQNTVASYEMGRIGVSDSVIISICREFGVNENWLRTGNGEIYKTTEDKLSTYLAQIAKGNDDFIKDIIEVYMEVDESSRQALKEIAKRMIDKHNKRG